MEKYLKSFTKEDFTKLYHGNEKFEDFAYNAAIEMVDFWISDYLLCFKGCFLDYGIYSNSYSCIEIKDNKDFIECLKDYKASYDLNEDMSIKLDEAIKLIEKYNPSEDDEEYYKLEEEIEEIAETLKDMLLESWLSEYRYYDEKQNVINYIIDDIKNNEMFEDSYIKDNDYSKVYEIIPEHERIAF